MRHADRVAPLRSGLPEVRLLPTLEALAPDVAAQLQAVEVNPVAGGIDVGDGLLKGGTGVGHAEDPAAGGFDRLLVTMHSGFGIACSSVEDSGSSGRSSFEAGNGVAPANRSRITVRGEYDADGGFLAEPEQTRILPAEGGGVDESAKVAVQAMQQGLRFGVAEPHVEFEDLGPVGCHHQTGIEEADEGRTLGLHTVQDRLHDGTNYQLAVGGGKEAGIGVGAHAAGVGAEIVFKDRLVILGGFERQDALTVAQADEADLLAGEELLDHQLAAGGADEVAGKHIMKCRKSGGAIRTN